VVLCAERVGEEARPQDVSCKRSHSGAACCLPTADVGTEVGSSVSWITALILNIIHRLSSDFTENTPHLHYKVKQIICLGKCLLWESYGTHKQRERERERERAKFRDLDLSKSSRLSINLNAYCTMFGSSTTSDHQLYRVSSLRKPFGLLIHLLQSHTIIYYAVSHLHSLQSYMPIFSSLTVFITHFK
jgi:hypothetical protein